MALSDRTKKISLVISLSDYDMGSLFEFKNELYSFLVAHSFVEFAFILHDLDKMEDGELKHKHIHLYAEAPKIKRLGTFLNDFAKGLKVPTLAISIEKASSMEACIQYLIHKNAPDKFQYSMMEIVTNINRDELALILERPIEAFNVDFILHCWKVSASKVDFIKMIGLERYRLYRNVIRDLIEDSFKVPLR